jgi:hypothetical protein
LLLLQRVEMMLQRRMLRVTVIVGVRGDSVRQL